MEFERDLLVLIVRPNDRYFDFAREKKLTILCAKQYYTNCEKQTHTKLQWTGLLVATGRELKGGGGGVKYV